MSAVRYRVLRELDAEHPISGAQLGRRLGVSRAAVWKQIEALRAAGVEIIVDRGEGYRLTRPVEWLDAGRILSALAPELALRLRRLTVLEETDSTNAWVRRQPEPGTIVALAEAQTAGRGRRGRSWQSPPCAGVWLSVRHVFEDGVRALGLLGLATAVACARGIESCAGVGVGLKWPNDLMLDGRKLGGILVELGGEAEGPCEAVVGVGVNVYPPAAASLDQPAVGLAELVPGVSRNALAAALVNRLVGAFEALGSGSAPALLRDWRSRDVLAGHAVTVESVNERLSGDCRGISERGGLLLATASGEREFLSAEVSVRHG